MFRHISGLAILFLQCISMCVSSNYSGKTHAWWWWWWWWWWRWWRRRTTMMIETCVVLFTYISTTCITNTVRKSSEYLYLILVSTLLVNMNRPCVYISPLCPLCYLCHCQTKTSRTNTHLVLHFYRSVITSMCITAMWSCLVSTNLIRTSLTIVKLIEWSWEIMFLM